MIRTRTLIRRQMLRAEPETLFVFGDNMKERGFGGQAADMRGEPNAVGIPTKWQPSMREDAFFVNSDLPAVEGLIMERFRRLRSHLANGGEVVWPANGVGTGMADLQRRAPEIWGLIERLRGLLFETYLAKD